MSQEEGLLDFFSKFRTLHFRRGETIIRAGENPSGVFYLSKGYVRLYALSKDGQKFSLIIFKTGDIFPLTWSLANIKTEYFVEAMTPCLIFRADKRSFVNLLKNQPQVYQEITEGILARLYGLLKRMEYMAFGNAYSKICSILLICADRFGVIDGAGILIQVPLTHEDIASLVGVTRETASIELKKLEVIGAIRKKKRLLQIAKIQLLKKGSQAEIDDVRI